MRIYYKVSTCISYQLNFQVLLEMFSHGSFVLIVVILSKQNNQFAMSLLAMGNLLSIVINQVKISHLQYHSPVSQSISQSIKQSIKQSSNHSIVN